MTKFRAAIWTDERNQAEIVLTGPEQAVLSADLSDEEFLANAEAEYFGGVGKSMTSGRIYIGVWETNWM